VGKVDKEQNNGTLGNPKEGGGQVIQGTIRQETEKGVEKPQPDEEGLSST